MTDPRRPNADEKVGEWMIYVDALEAENTRLRAALEDLVSALEDGDSIFRQVSKAKAALERTP